MALPKKLHWAPKKKDQRGPEWKPRRCKHCKLMFTPADKNPANAKRAKFCGKKCKDGYHRHGGMNTDRLIDYVTKGVLQRLHADETFLDSLADKLRASSLGSMVRQLAREEIKAENTVRVDLDLETELERVAKLPGKPS
jgi:hypothetical protein